MGVDTHRLGRFQLRLLALDDVPDVLLLREEVLAGLSEPDLYIREADEPGFVGAHIGGQPGSSGEAIGVFDGRRLVAYAMLGLPAADEADNLGHALGLASAERAEVAHIASCMVREPYRGHGLQRVLLAARFSLAQAHGRRVCAGMVSLHNQASRRNLMREGMRVAWVGHLNGLRRQILALHLRQPWTFSRDRIELVESLDFERQCALARQGWWGVSVLEGPGQDALVFAALEKAAAPCHTLFHIPPHAAPR